MGYGGTDTHPHDDSTSSISPSDDDLGIIPKGALDPVYEAKARLLNRAVRISVSCPLLLSVALTRCFAPGNRFGISAWGGINGSFS